MSTKRRANNRGRSRPKTNLDDLDGALTSMIGSQQEVKLTVNPSDEHRFTMNSNDDNHQRGGIFASNTGNKNVDRSGSEATHTSNFEKHQVNYGATKYIKP
eukprot:CAMPEP_0201873434 /NCGR_PEP_ID=MMETSP0902-20130614/5935_1 /ASSEMBLY_ACC=CAM_ASM_000551 /TAXON_ID=420261 /ORGANISM="Thalassiosira antarctica, Strain CCMP982" /LENGTH=100 /DNA_ID=CAMNT_0048400025 /DNA_START=76 /DNA_END=378 /DNA_ORIENTATION=-